MVALIFDRSKHIPERLIGLISEVRSGIVFHNACTYEEAIELLNEKSPHVVLLDFNFPGSVIDLLKRIKVINNKTVVIVLFTVAEEKKLQLYKEHGADFLFDKYHEFEKIPSVISLIPAS